MTRSRAAPRDWHDPMRHPTLLSIIDGLHYLFLGIWLGAIVMLAVGAPIAFRVVREHRPALQAEPYNRPELADRAAPILAGAVVGHMLRGLSVVQVACALGAGATLAARRVWLRRAGAADDGVGNAQAGTPTIAAVDDETDAQRHSRLAAHARTALLIVAVAVLLFDRVWLTPQVWQTRVAMYDTTATASSRDQARSRFDGLHKTSERLVSLTALSLAVALVLTPLALRPGRDTSR